MSGRVFALTLELGCRGYRPDRGAAIVCSGFYQLQVTARNTSIVRQQERQATASGSLSFHSSSSRQGNGGYSKQADTVFAQTCFQKACKEK